MNNIDHQITWEGSQTKHIKTIGLTPDTLQNAVFALDVREAIGRPAVGLAREPAGGVLVGHLLDLSRVGTARRVWEIAAWVRGVDWAFVGLGNTGERVRVEALLCHHAVGVL